MRTRGLVCGGLALLAEIAPVRAQRPARSPPARLVRGTLSFDCHPTLGDFVGTTASVRGDVPVGPELAAVRAGRRAGGRRAGRGGRGGGGYWATRLRPPSLARYNARSAACTTLSGARSVSSWSETPMLTVMLRCRRFFPDPLGASGFLRGR